MLPWDTIITAAGALLAGVLGSYFLFRGKRVEQEIAEGEVEASAADAFLKGQASFQQYVDGVVDQRVNAAVAELREQLEEMKRTLQGVRDESHEMNVAIRARETQLWLWNLRNRPGPMPELPEPILGRLGIGHLRADVLDEDTEPLRRFMPKPEETS
ncbi:hypothetical protein [Microbacterium sp. 1P06AB]|uniref:hypothetical protein n=1 Tax=Microbacterium sp. 1P06AB TaxID=3132289 RepID=UPI0039A628F4